MIEREALVSHPITVGDKAYTFHSEAIKVNLPFMKSVWNRPTRITEIDLHVATDDDEDAQTTIPIINQTRWLVWGLFTLAFGFGVIGGVISMLNLWRQTNNDQSQ